MYGQMDGTRKNYTDLGVPDPERWIRYSFPYMCILAVKSNITKLQFIEPQTVGTE